MAIRIISAQERNKFSYDESVFYYRRISMSKSMELTKKHTKRGLADNVAIGVDIMQWCLLDWENVIGLDGEPLAFSKDLVPDLPDEVINELTPLLREASPTEDAMGN